MDSEHFTIAKAVNTAESGLGTECRGEGFYIMQVVKLPMKDNGSKTVLMDMEFYTTKISE
jgi:hypothetical protein